jgi:hypothetical protein
MSPDPLTSRLRYWFVILVALALTVPPLITYGAYLAGYAAGQRAADEDAVFRAVYHALHEAPHVLALRDTVATQRRQLAVQASARLPQHVRDSLRLVRWTTPP